MDPKMMAKQVIEFNKKAFDNTFNAMVSSSGSNGKSDEFLHGAKQASPGGG